MPEIKARIALDASTFKQGMADAEKGADPLGAAMKKLGPMIAAAFSVGAIKSFIASALALGDEIDNLATRMNMGTDTVQMLQRVSKEAGISFGEVEATVHKLNSEVAKAASGNAAAAGQFAALGISMEDLRTKSPEQMLEAVAQGLVENEGNAAATGAAYKILGTEHAGKLMAALKDLGTQGFAALTAEMEKNGIILSTTSVAGLNAAELAVDKLSTKLKNFFMDKIAWYGEQFFADELWHDQQKKTAEAYDRQIALQKELAAEAEDGRRVELESELARYAELTAKLMGEQTERATSLRDLKEQEHTINERLAGLYADVNAQQIDRVRTENELLDVQLKIRDATEAIAKRQKEWNDLLTAAEAARNKANLDAQGDLQEAYRKLFDSQMTTGERVASRLSDIEFQKTILITEQNALIEAQADGLGDILGDNTRLTQIQAQLVNLETERLGLADKLAEKTEEMKDETFTAKQAEELIKINDILTGLTDSEIDDFINTMRRLADGLNKLPTVGGMGWLRDISAFTGGRSFTDSQARQLIRAFTVLANGLAGLPKVDMDTMNALAKIRDIRIPSFTDSQARQFERAIKVVIGAMQGLIGIDPNAIGQMAELFKAAKGVGNAKVEVVVPEGGLLLTIPDQFALDISALSYGVTALAGMKGVVWA